MIVFTKQGWEAGHKILAGKYIPDFNKVQEKDARFKETLDRSYKWMQKQYALKFNTDPEECLMYGWTKESIPYSYKRFTKRKLKKNFFFELEIENFLISHFDKWHSVLNNQPIYPKEFDKLDHKKWEKATLEYDQHINIEKTWLDIFENVEPKDQQVVFSVKSIVKIIRWNCGKGWKYL